MPECRFGDGPAIARFHLPGGCVVYKSERHFDLCPHHVLNATPLDGMYLIGHYAESDAEWERFCRESGP